MTSAIPIVEPQPSQLYIDAARLRAALDWFDFDDPDYEPVPVIDLGNETVMTDGHTRAFLARLGGAEELVVRPDPDRAELNLDLYRECVTWCRAESVTRIDDLVGRVVSRDTFLVEWVARCEASPHAETG